YFYFFFSSRRRHTRSKRDWSSDVCSSDLLEVIKDCEANLSKKGARMCMAPVNKFKMILAGLLAGYVIQLVALALLFLYLIFVFRSEERRVGKECRAGW